MKVHLRMVGCRLNQSEIDTMARQFRRLGHEIVNSPEQADHFIVNTCAVTNQATKTSRKLIRDFQRVNLAGETTVTGCYAQIAPHEIGRLPGVRRLVANGDKSQLVSQITGETIDIFDSEPHERDAPFGRTRAFVKAQDGCDNACTFCVTTIARGAGRSRSIDEILREVNYLRRAGYQEAVLTGVHLGSFGHDRADGACLTQLVRSLLSDTDMPRIRLSSLEPWDLAPDFFSLWEDRRLCRHLHLPLQSGCDDTLRRMRRNSNQRQFRALVEAAKAAIPELRLTTDVIVGFPGETDQEFDQSERFISEMEFGGLHVFRYSSRPGTPASRMRNQISDSVKKARSSRLLKQSKQMEQRFAESLNGSESDVLWEQVSGASPAGYIVKGYSDNYMRVRTVHRRDLTNTISPTQLGAYTEGEVHGTLKETAPQHTLARK